MKKIVILLLSVLMLFSFASCSPKTPEPVEPTADDLKVISTFWASASKLQSGSYMKEYCKLENGVVILTKEFKDGDIVLESFTMESNEESKTMILNSKFTLSGTAHTIKTEMKDKKTTYTLDGKLLKDITAKLQ